MADLGRQGRLRTSESIAIARVLTQPLRELNEKGYVSWTRRGMGKTNIYRILDIQPKELEPSSSSPPPTSKPRSPESDVTVRLHQDVTASSHQNVTQRLHKKDSVEKNSEGKDVYLSNIRNAKSDGFDYVNSDGSANDAAERTRLTHNEEVEPSQTHSTPNGRNIEENEKYKHFAAAQKNDQIGRPAEPERKGGLAHIGHTVQARLPMAPATVAAADAREAIAHYLRETAVKLHDEAPLKSSTTRAFNLYERSGVDFSTFYTLMYDAEKEALHHTATIKKLTTQGFKNRMAYFFAILEDKLGLREKPLSHGF